MIRLCMPYIPLVIERKCVQTIFSLHSDGQQQYLLEYLNSYDLLLLTMTFATRFNNLNLRVTWVFIN